VHREKISTQTERIAPADESATASEPPRSLACRRDRGSRGPLRESTDQELDGWPVGEPFALLPSMQALTLRVILRSVFGFEPGPVEDRLQARLRAMVEPMSRPRG
jgi:cytochrome P450